MGGRLVGNGVAPHQELSFGNQDHIAFARINNWRIAGTRLRRGRNPLTSGTGGLTNARRQKQNPARCLSPSAGGEPPSRAQQNQKRAGGDRRDHSGTRAFFRLGRVRDHLEFLRTRKPGAYRGYVFFNLLEGARAFGGVLIEHPFDGVGQRFGTLRRDACHGSQPLGRVRMPSHPTQFGPQFRDAGNLPLHLASSREQLIEEKAENVDVAADMAGVIENCLRDE